MPKRKESYAMVKQRLLLPLQLRVIVNKSNIFIFLAVFFKEILIKNFEKIKNLAIVDISAILHHF